MMFWTYLTCDLIFFGVLKVDDVNKLLQFRLPPNRSHVLLSFYF